MAADDAKVKKLMEKFNREMRRERETGLSFPSPRRKPRKPKNDAERAERDAALQARIDELVRTHTVRSLAGLVADMEANEGVLEGWDL